MPSRSIQTAVARRMRRRLTQPAVVKGARWLSVTLSAMERDAVFGPLVLAPLEIVGVESLADGFATVRVKFKTPPLNQGKVANELRRRLMTAFVGRGIRPYAG